MPKSDDLRRQTVIVEDEGLIAAGLQRTSQPGKGTTFELPCVGTFCDVPVANQPASASSVPIVLLVEDEDSVRRLMQRFLEREGYQVLEARNGEEAQDLAYENSIDVMVTDLMMPGMTGPELAERLAPSHPDMRVLFVSGYRYDVPEHQGLRLSELNLLPKPFAASEFLRRVQLLLKEEALVTPPAVAASLWKT